MVLYAIQWVIIIDTDSQIIILSFFHQNELLEAPLTLMDILISRIMLANYSLSPIRVSEEDKDFEFILKLI